MELFDKFDRINYQGFELTNILRRVKAVKSILNKIDVFYDYTIKEGERADTIAFDYYGDSIYTWLIYIANNIYDPYYQWPLTSYQLFKFIDRKYGDPYQAQIDIHHYQNKEKDFFASKTTFDNWTMAEREGWYPVTNYDYEVELNEKKRQIKLISNEYLNQINQQIEELFT